MRSDAASAGAHALRSITWDLVVADEAQHIKSPASSTAKALRTIEAHARIALSGTPVENNLTELWAILDWAVPGLLGSRDELPTECGAQIATAHGRAKARKSADVRELLHPRRRKTDPGNARELPAETETENP